MSKQMEIPTADMPQHKRDGWDLECVICGCKWMEEENTECPRCILTGMVQANQGAGAYDPPGSEGMRAMINSLTAELAEAVALVNERDQADVDTCLTLEADIDAWHAAELAEGRDVPDFWDDCRTSEWLASHLTSLGYAREPALLAAIQTHHDTKHGRAGGRSAAVLVAGDRALYEAAGIKHAVLGFDVGGRAPSRIIRESAASMARLYDAGFVEDEQMLAFEAVIAADGETLRALDEVRRAPARALRPAAQKIADGLNEALDYVNNAATKETTNV